MKFFLTCITIFIFFSAFGQITKDNWLVGGMGNFLASNVHYSNNTDITNNKIDITISAKVGYFVIDKFAAGLQLNYSKFQENTSNGAFRNENRFKFGPFVRYYFLETESRYNIIADVNYLYGKYWFKPSKGYSNAFSASIGPVIYFNANVGLEFLLGYYQQREDISINHSTFKQEGFQANIGFQISLEK